MIYNLDIFTTLFEIGESIIQSLRTALGYLSGFIYNSIADLYKLFEVISKAQFLDNDFVNDIYRKVGLILGIFMCFKLMFSLIQALIEPAKLTDKKSGFSAIIGRCLISIVLLGLTPTIFKEAMSLQNVLVGANHKDDILYKLIIGKNISGKNDFGMTLASELFFGFYTDNKDPYFENGISYNPSQEGLFEKNDYESIKKSIESREKSFTDAATYLSAVDSNGDYFIEFESLFCLIVGIVVCYMLILYCIQTGIRVFQLAYLQLIAPIPILSYISDSEGSFKKWINQCVTTYLDLFIRLAIIYFIVHLSSYILEQLNTADSNIIISTGLSPDDSLLTWVRVFLIIALLMFGKKVPDLLKDLFPNMGGGVASLGFGLKSPKKMLADIPYVGGAANKVLGFSGNLAKKGANFAWAHTGGAAANKVKTNFNRWKDDRAGYKEEYKKDKEAADVWNKYGAEYDRKDRAPDYEKIFSNGRDSNGEFASTFKELAEAKKAMGEVISAGYTRDSKEYMEAEKRVNDAQKNHDINRNKYKDLARREDNLKRYKNRHPSASGSNNNNNSNNNRPVSQPPLPSQPHPQPTTQSQQQAQPQPRSQTTPSQESIPRRPEQYDERIDFATNRYYELQDSGASDDELQQQLDSINALNEGKAEAERYYREVDNHLDEVDERNNDGFGGQ